MTIENLNPQERWEQMPRPLKYARPRLYAEDAAYLQGLLEDEQTEVIGELAEYRRQGKPEDGTLIVECREALEKLANIIREVSRARIDLAGGEGGQ